MSAFLLLSLLLSGIGEGIYRRNITFITTSEVIDWLWCGLLSLNITSPHRKGKNTIALYTHIFFPSHTHHTTAIMKFVTTAVVTLLTLTHALPLQTRSNTLSPRQDLTTLEEETDTLLFHTSMDDFQAARDAEDPPELDWYSNGCTASPDVPLGYSFLPSCQRHDFGYHNYKAQDRFTDDNKHQIDLNFKADLYNECNKHGAVSGLVCKGIANVYYAAVSVFGGIGSTTPDEAR